MSANLKRLVLIPQKDKFLIDGFTRSLSRLVAEDTSDANIPPLIPALCVLYYHVDPVLEQLETVLSKTKCSHILTKMHPNVSLDDDAVRKLQSILFFMFNRVVQEASKNAKNRQSATLNARDIKEARTVSIINSDDDAKDSIEMRDVLFQSSSLGPSFCAVLIVTPACISECFAKSKCAEKSEHSADMYLAAVMGFVLDEILDLSGKQAKDNDQTLICSDHIAQGVAADDQLRVIFKK